MDSDGEGKLMTICNSLDFSKARLVKLLCLFRMIDNDESGLISFEEFYDFLGIEPSKFVKRVFSVMDIDHSGRSKGNLDASEFLVGILNFCLLSPSQLPGFMFDMYDVDDSEEMSKDELATMVMDVMGGDHPQHQVDNIVKMFDADMSGTIDKKEFEAVERRAASLLRPAVLLQGCMRSKCLGTYFWDDVSRQVSRKLGFEGVGTVAEMYERDRKALEEQLARELAEEKAAAEAQAIVDKRDAFVKAKLATLNAENEIAAGAAAAAHARANGLPVPSSMSDERRTKLKGSAADWADGRPPWH